MNDLKNSIITHINWIDEHLNFYLFTGKNLINWFRPLIDSITDDGAVPYLLDVQDKERFRASPLSSTIIWLNDAGLLPANALEVMHNKLLYLRDNNETDDKDIGITRKLIDDNDGWSLAEGVSIWSTSLAIIALNDQQGVGLKKSGQYKDSVMWLAKQQVINKKGWAYQLHRNCTDNVIMTSLALRALSLAQKNKLAFRFSDDEERYILTALTSGYTYLKETIVCEKTKEYSYWCFADKPHCAATTWALMALNEIRKLENMSEDINEFYNENIKRGIDFVISHMPKKVSKWEDEQIVCEGGAKYNKQKNYYSFTPTLLSQLFSLGLSPYHPKVLNQIVWLVTNPEEWKVKKYDQDKICAFTYAMVIATIAKWILYAGQANSVYLLDIPSKKSEKIMRLIFGLPVLKSSPVQIVYKTRLWFLFLLLSIIFVFITFGGKIYFSIKEIIGYTLKSLEISGHEIIIDIIASFIYAAIVAFGLFILNKLRKIFKRWDT